MYEVTQSAETLRQRVSEIPDTCMVLSSGWNNECCARDNYGAIA